jgi:hypothetical protein
MVNTERYKIQKDTGKNDETTYDKQGYSGTIGVFDGVYRRNNVRLGRLGRLEAVVRGIEKQRKVRHCEGGLLVRSFDSRTAFLDDQRVRQAGFDEKE